MMEVVLRYRREKLARERAAQAGRKPGIGAMVIRTVIEEKK